MRTRSRTIGVLAAAALAAGALTAASGSPAAAQTDNIQTQINSYLATHPGEKQIAPDKATMPGGDVTFPATNTVNTAAISCSYGHLCIQDGNGTRYDYYYCGLYSFGGVGDGYFNNNQTPGTVAKFYNSNGSLRWTSTAPQSGTASWTPVYSIRPC